MNCQAVLIRSGQVWARLLPLALAQIDDGVLKKT
jgi:hypothetical protein